MCACFYTFNLVSHFVLLYHFLLYSWVKLWNEYNPAIYLLPNLMKGLNEWLNLWSSCVQELKNCIWAFIYLFIYSLSSTLFYELLWFICTEKWIGMVYIVIRVRSLDLQMTPESLILTTENSSTRVLLCTCLLCF